MMAKETPLSCCWFMLMRSFCFTRLCHGENIPTFQRETSLLFSFYFCPLAGLLPFRPSPPLTPPALLASLSLWPASEYLAVLAGLKKERAAAAAGAAAAAAAAVTTRTTSD